MKMKYLWDCPASVQHVAVSLQFHPHLTAYGLSDPAGGTAAYLMVSALGGKTLGCYGNNKPPPHLVASSAFKMLLWHPALLSALVSFCSPVQAPADRLAWFLVLQLFPSQWASTQTAISTTSFRCSWHGEHEAQLQQRMADSAETEAAVFLFLSQCFFDLYIDFLKMGPYD